MPPAKHHNSVITRFTSEGFCLVIHAFIGFRKVEAVHKVKYKSPVNPMNLSMSGPTLQGAMLQTIL